jgi:hypothetical protein
MNRTVSSLTSQFMLPKELSNAVPELFSNYLDAKNITYEEINAENISLDYTPGGDPTKISLVTLMQQLLAGGDISIKVPNASNPSESDNYHLHLLKNNAPDSRIKILANTYQKLCQKIADKIIEHDGDVADYDKMVALVKDYLARIFFIDHNQDNKPYTNTSQISNTF